MLVHDENVDDDILIIGAGSAGLSAAAELAEHCSTGRGICVVDAEHDVALHTSARPAQQLIRTAVVVNAAGPWADDVAALLGAPPQGLQPLRRTAALVTVEQPMPAEHPMVIDAADKWCYRPDPVGAMLSAGEAEPSEPCDAQPHEGAIDALVATVERETSLRVTGVVKAWRGLCTERASDVPVCGWDRAVEGLFRLAGQGGHDFQTSTAMAAAAAEQILDGCVGEWLSLDTVAVLQPGVTA